MTHVAYSLAALSHPDAKYDRRRSSLINQASHWARMHDYKFERRAVVQSGVFTGAIPELGVIAGMQQKLERGELPLGTALILDDFGSLSQDDLRKVLALLMTLPNYGLRVVTLSDHKVWDEQAINDYSGFMISVTLGYAETLRARRMGARVRHTLKQKKERAAMDAAQ